MLYMIWTMGRDSSDSVVTRYGMDGPGIKSQRGARFSAPSRPALGPTQPPIQWVPPPSSAKVKERVGLHFYSPSWPSWPVLGEIYPFLNLYITGHWLKQQRKVMIKLIHVYFCLLKSIQTVNMLLHTESSRHYEHEENLMNYGHPTPQKGTML